MKTTINHSPTMKTATKPPRLSRSPLSNLSTSPRTLSFAEKRRSMLVGHTNQNRRGFAELHPSGRSRRVLVLYTGGTIGMMPSSRGYVCQSGYLPKLLQSLPMFHDPEYDLSQEILPNLTFHRTPTTSIDKSTSVSDPTTTNTNTTTTSETNQTTTPSPSNSPSTSPISPPFTASTTASTTAPTPYDIKRDAKTPERLNKHLDESFSLSTPLITPISEYGRRTLYYIKEYDPLLDSCNMVDSDWARVARDVEDNYEEFDAFVVLHGTDTMA